MCLTLVLWDKFGRHTLVKHIFNQLILAQLESGTLYCGGFDTHAFPAGLGGNMAIYGFRNGGEIDRNSETFDFYIQATILQGVDIEHRLAFAGLLTAIENYLFEVLEVSVRDCGLRIFKPQLGLYIQFGPVGIYLLQRLRRQFDVMAKKYSATIIPILDAKPGDIMTTQVGYLLGYMGNLLDSWGIDHEPLSFPITNPTPWMGDDVLVLGNGKGGPDLGLQLLKQGKGLIYVNKTSNPSGPRYQDLLVQADGNKPMALSLLNAADAYALSQKHGLEDGDTSQLGLVVGATHPCDGLIRSTFPTTTLLVPGFGAQSLGSTKKDPLTPFRKIMLELRRDFTWNGLGAIFSSSRNHLFPWQKKYGGQGTPNSLEMDLKRVVNQHRELEAQMYEQPELQDAGITNPFV